MASRLGGEEDEIITEINVTPLVDIMLVLLIIFMVTATYIVNPSIKVDLPKAATGDETQTSTLSVVLEKSGQLYLNGQATSEDELASAVRAAKAQKEDVQAIVSADKEVSHGAVIRLIDLVKLNGVTRFALNIDPASRAEAPPQAGNVSAPAVPGGN